KDQTVEVIKYQKLQALMNGEVEGQKEKISVINFWASWCGPCIKEIPYFEALVKSNSDHQLQVYLISLDDVNDLGKKVQPLVDRKKLHSKVWLLDEIDFNEWVGKVNSQWSGVIPATLLINHQNGKRLFHEGELSEVELNQFIHQIN
ncbi:TlpA disulfide reductase family protein, partial [Xanthovirga aplysinae]|uniref:TlpA disulfide reductase family protein n=1 Tax=Xanthovirga aplysinae TaxID=2529853 RepID=UPI0012BD0BB9